VRAAQPTPPALGAPYPRSASSAKGACRTASRTRALRPPGLQRNSLPTEAAAPVGITVGPDGALWFVEIAAGQIGRITTDGQVTEFPLPDRTARPHAITTDGNGTLWFTEWGGNRVGSIAPGGAIAEYDLPTPGSEPHGITLGPDGALWTALEIGTLARITSANNGG
jgi:virginiamycin B lyase